MVRERPDSKVTLFIHRLPFHVWTDNTRTPPGQFWSIQLPEIPAGPGLVAPPPTVQPQDWVLDTGNTGEALAWRQHLVAAGLDPDMARVGFVGITSSLGGKKQFVPVRQADLWLVSNIPSLANSPFRLELFPGIPFRDVPQNPDPQLQRPLIGMRALRRSGLLVELDYASDTVSIWTPNP